MTVTRDEALTAQIGQLFQAFNGCAEGFEIDVVIQASVNLVVAAINHRVQTTDGDQAEALQIANTLAQQLPGLVSRQWERTARPDDVVVPLKGN